ncbi:FKBP-type peptidyl-prolyl cis-trans isomerase SlyD [Balneicella halophila]|uniref:Peptidyl-prolyl cis-trans isomerase n=1 Tax=Balneicella halophila TaxID=1537566 RepID=A0A7L4UMQ2_BALHA|nr:peptidylprolyl isomerase [Balneicella halophila]PVX49906.1 FKBP-type peptidyl-prolyl cis-trans isomerase SlyD [Balneicella halophila]
MKIAKDAMVALQYELYGNEKGDLIEKTKKEEPLVFLFGQGTMLPSFENHVEGLREGDTFDFKLKPEEAYGEFNEEAVQDLDINIFKGEDGNVDTNIIKEGNVVPLMTQDGQRLQAVVIGVTEDKVKMDFNHPLAGETLHFKGTVAEVREATEAELSAVQSCGCGEGGNCCEDEKGHGECNDGNCCH